MCCLLLLRPLYSGLEQPFLLATPSSCTSNLLCAQHCQRLPLELESTAIRFTISWVRTSSTHLEKRPNETLAFLGIINASIFVFTPHPGPLLPHRPESPLPPPKPRDLEAEAEKVKAQIIAAGVSLDGEPIDATPPPPPGESKPLERRPSSRARESPFPVHTREALGHDSKMESDGQDDAPVGKQNDTVSTDKTEARVPSSIYSQPSAALSSPLSIVVPSRAAKRTVRDPLAAIITIPKNPRPTGVTLRRVESTPQHAEVIVVTTPPLYHSPPSPQTAPPVFDLAFGAAFLV